MTPDVSGDQLLPPLVERSKVPLEPAATQVLLLQSTPRSVAVTPLVAALKLAPLLLERTIAPDDPTATKTPLLACATA